MDDQKLSTLREAIQGRGDLGAAIQAVFDVAQRGGGDEATAWLRQLEPLLNEAPIEALGKASLLAGALVEVGAAPAAFPMSMFVRIGEMLDLVPPKPAQAEDEDGEPSEYLPDAYYECERAAAAVLSRSVELRRTLPHKAVLLGRIRRYEERYGFLGKMLQVLDDERLLLVHPATARAWRARMGGIADNFQLHALLRAALAGTGPDRIAGARPDTPSVAAASDGPVDGAHHVASDWQLACWGAVLSDGSITGQKDTTDWIWNEGFPAEIEPFEGTRLVAIGPSAIQRSWNAARIFTGMRGWLSIDEAVPAAEARALLGRVAEQAKARRS